MPKSSQSWVLSAGLGLIPTNLEIPNYSATFSRSSPDSVGNTHDENMTWWEMLQDWRIETNGIGNFASLATLNPQSTIIACLSETYLSVIIDDLVQAQSNLGSKEQLIVISAGYSDQSRLGTSLIPVDARFQNYVGGALASLNARMTERIIRDFKGRRLTSSAVTSHVKTIASGLAKSTVYDRKKTNDAAIKKKIRQMMRTEGPHSASSLLRGFRDSGFACEQKRFRKIFDSTTN
jgi:hypothetical protein